MQARPLGWSWHPLAKYPRENQNGQIETQEGEGVPKSLADIFSNDEIQDAVVCLRNLRRILNQARSSWNPFIPPIILDQLEKCEAMLSGAIPHSLCPNCQGSIEVNEGCGLCMGQGWVPLRSQRSEVRSQESE